MSKIKLREEFEMKTGAHRFADQDYIKWLENLVEKLRVAEETKCTPLKDLTDENYTLRKKQR